VNDGSTDETIIVLEDIRDRRPGQVRILDLRRNQGKAEAVRRGMLEAIDQSPEYAGYWDADLATPLGVLPEFVGAAGVAAGAEMVLGSRVQLLGRRIERSPMRHYLGRIFATTVSLLLGIRVYDTQCGAKLFRVDERMRSIFAEPFRSRWIFDVELLARFMRLRRAEGGEPLEEICEEPLPEWRDVAGSKVGPTAFVTAFFDLVRIYLRSIRAARGRRELNRIPGSGRRGKDEGGGLFERVADVQAAGLGLQVGAARTLSGWGRTPARMTRVPRESRRRWRFRGRRGR
jgi:dolichyl-phosphate beta-glucosyltransferase